MFILILIETTFTKWILNEAEQKKSIKTPYVK